MRPPWQPETLSLDPRAFVEFSVFFVGVSCWVQDLPGLLLDLRTGFRVLGPSGYRDSGCSHRQHVCVVSVVQRESVCVCVRARVRACVRTRTQ